MASPIPTRVDFAMIRDGMCVSPNQLTIGITGREFFLYEHGGFHKQREFPFSRMFRAGRCFTFGAASGALLEESCSPPTRPEP